MKDLRFGYWVILVWAVVSYSHAGDFLGPGQAVGGTVSLPAGKIFKTVYAAGQTVSIEKPVHGCLYLAGDDLQVQAAVGGNAHLIGKKVWVDGLLGNDLIVLAQDLRLSPRSSLGGDLVGAGKDLLVEGRVQGGIWVVGNQVTLNGTVEGGGMVRFDHSLILGPNCRLKGKIICYGPNPPQVDPAAVAPGIDYRQKESVAIGVHRLSRFGNIFGLPALVRLAAWLLAAWCLTLVFPGFPERFWGRVEDHPARDLALGLLVFLAGAVLVPVLFLTLVGWYLSLAVGVLLLAALILARLLAFFYLSLFLWRFLETKKIKFPPFRWVAGSILVLHLLGAFPWIGTIISLGLSLTALGILARWGNRLRQGH